MSKPSAVAKKHVDSDSSGSDDSSSDEDNVNIIVCWFFQIFKFAFCFEALVLTMGSYIHSKSRYKIVGP